MWTHPSHGKCLLSLTKYGAGSRLHSCQSGVRGESCGCSQEMVVRGGFMETVEMSVSLCGVGMHNFHTVKFA